MYLAKRSDILERSPTIPTNWNIVNKIHFFLKGYMYNNERIFSPWNPEFFPYLSSHWGALKCAPYFMDSGSEESKSYFCWYGECHQNYMIFGLWEILWIPFFHFDPDGIMRFPLEFANQKPTRFHLTWDCDKPKTEPRFFGQLLLSLHDLPSNFPVYLLMKSVLIHEKTDFYIRMFSG